MNGAVSRMLSRPAQRLRAFGHSPEDVRAAEDAARDLAGRANLDRAQAEDVAARLVTAGVPVPDLPDVLGQLHESSDVQACTSAFLRVYVAARVTPEALAVLPLRARRVLYDARPDDAPPEWPVGETPDRFAQAMHALTPTSTTTTKGQQP